jgi:DNA-binding NtrC family response regulator
MSNDILVVDDDKVLNRLVIEQLKNMGYNGNSAHSWAEAQDYLSKNEPGLVILDCRLPDCDGYKVIPELSEQQPVIVFTAYASVRSAVNAIKNGATEYLTKPVDLEEFELVVTRVLEHATLRRDHKFCKQKMQALNGKNVLGHTMAMQNVHNLINSVAPSDMTVLIEGESGVGKQLVAQEIHRNSTRSEFHFVEIDCCSLHEQLFESELFGHERGAFTGANSRKQGLIEGAENGTLFLDEIGEIDSSIQSKLLRVLESGQFRRLGGTKDLKANVRIVAATNKQLEKMSSEGSFRPDLYYRLSAFMLQVPPLRERREDISDLVNYFILNHDFSRRFNKEISPKTMEELIQYDWPGNIRELKNVVERAIILSGDQSIILPSHLTYAITQTAGSMGVSLNFNHDPTLKEIEQLYLQKIITKFSGNRAHVAEIMGISERNLYRLIRKYQID